MPLLAQVWKPAVLEKVGLWVGDLGWCATAEQGSSSGGAGKESSEVAQVVLV